MKVHLLPPDVNSYALLRVVMALMRYAPAGVELVDNQDEAEVVVLSVIGRQDKMYRIGERLAHADQDYAIIQYCLRSTQRPDTDSWLGLWRGARLVWSYYDLYRWCDEEGTPTDFPFYHAPLGVDSYVFRPRQEERDYLICTSGQSAVTESVREAVHAARRLGGRVLHLGPELGYGTDVECVTGLGDGELAYLYNRCQFVAGLRRKEGFELPAAEGLLCGARPVCFDRHHYRQWYDPWAEFIHEGDRDYVIDALERLFNRGARPVTDEERAAAVARFDWETIAGGFWDSLWTSAS